MLASVRSIPKVVSESAANFGIGDTCVPRNTMSSRTSSVASIALAAALCATIGGATAHDGARYPDWAGRWMRTTSGSFDPNKPAGLRQGPPLTPEYQVIFEASVADQAAGGQ